MGISELQLGNARYMPHFKFKKGQLSKKMEIGSCNGSAVSSTTSYPMCLCLLQSQWKAAHQWRCNNEGGMVHHQVCHQMPANQLKWIHTALQGSGIPF